MKKQLKLLGLFFLIGTTLFAAPKTINKNVVENEDGSLSIVNVDKTDAVKYKQKVDGFKNVTVIDGAKVDQLNPVNIDLQDFGNKEVYINFSVDIKVEDSTDAENDIIWVINDLAAGVPEIAKKKVKSGEWTTIKGEKALVLSDKRLLYISGAGLNFENLKFYIKNLNVTFSGEGLGGKFDAATFWTDAPSLKEAYDGIFDYFGFAVGHNGEFQNPAVQEGVAHHADSITMGNEMKPDFIFNWAKPSNMEDFVAEDGNTYKVPMGMPNFGKLKEILMTAMINDLTIRGHVLVWHSQTPDWFFKENYSLLPDAAYVDKATMNARLEWYIKSVIDFVVDFENRYNKGERIVTVWDVVNEAVSDGATSTRWLREDSDWFRVYKNEEFIVNAFRYANKYAPKECLLVYNDYNCYSPAKLNGICNVIDAIKASPDARIDAIGMQSHVKIDYPNVTGHNSYEKAVQTFIEKGLDVQVTELDIANGKKQYSSILLKAKYKEYFNMFINNRKTADKKGITGVTIWGLVDKKTWLNNQNEYKGHKQYPLIFKDDYNVKPAFWGVYEAAEEFKEENK